MEEKEIKCNCKDNCACDEHECNCSEECTCNENNPIVIEMEDENGKKVKVEVIGTFDDNDKSYAIVNDLDNPDNSYIFEVQTTDMGDMLVSVDDEKEFDRLCKVVEKLIA